LNERLRYEAEGELRIVKVSEKTVQRGPCEDPEKATVWEVKLKRVKK